MTLQQSFGFARLIVMENKEESNKNELVQALFSVGAHFGYARSRRHPSVTPYIFGVKNQVEIFDLEKTLTLLEKAKMFVRKTAQSRGQMLFVSGKKEAEALIKKIALELEMPYVAGRWIGGTLTNFAEIRKRVDRLLDLISKRDKGELAKYTKKERLLLDREIVNLERFFGGIVPMKQLPKVLFVIDPRKETTAITEAQKNKIPVIALSGSDCDVSKIEYPIVGNDGAMASIRYFLEEIAGAYKEGLMQIEEKAGEMKTALPTMAETAPEKGDVKAGI